MSEPDNVTLLAWLQEAEDDLGDLAQIVQRLAAALPNRRLADEAEQIAHRWHYRRNRRNVVR